MKLKIRYENEYQTIVLGEKDTEAMWVSLSLEGEGLSQEEREQLIQDTFEERFNRPDYNSWHKHDRHSGVARMKGKDGSVEVNTEEAIMDRAADKSVFTRTLDEVDNRMSYEYWCGRIREAFPADTAEMLIAIALDGMTAEEYAAVIGDKPNNVSHRYCRAIRKCKEIFPRTSF
ncbi:hypothetical protein NHG23_02450 [Aerococcaceae bacterium NML190073]|nr:hypothetical protein [Aerococcaceae bacterium NML190073]